MSTTVTAVRTPMPATVQVDAIALGQVLHALLGPSHHIREMLAIRDIVDNDPIGKLIEQYNEQVNAHRELHL